MKSKKFIAAKRMIAGLLAIALMLPLFSNISAYAAESKATAIFPNATEDDVIKAAESGLGVPYVWGGTTTSGWDCSGYVTWVGRKLGVDMGRNTTDIENYCSSKGATVVSGSSAEQFNSDFAAGTIKPGDIVVFFNSAGNSVHAAIVGRNQTIYHAWSENTGTINNRFDAVWGVNGGHGKVYTTYTIYRGVEDKGEAKIKKVSANKAMTNNNDCYSLSGATYGVYSDKSCTKSVATLTTNSDGNTDSVEIKAGTYYVKETKAPKGFLLDTTVYTLSVKAGETTTLEVTDNPMNDPAGIILNKIDKETGELISQGAASLEGAQFTVEYYDNLKGDISGKALKKWVIQTKYNKSSGMYRAFLSDEYKVSGDDFYKERGLVVLPLGTYAIWESKAPEGYLLEGAYLQAVGSSKKIEGKYISVVKEQNGSVVLQGGNEYSVSEQVIRGGVKVQKRDIETTKNTPQGNATLEDAEFTITSLNTNPVVVDGKTYKNNEVVAKLTTDSKGFASTSADLLPYGHYKITEIGEPKGYLNSGVISREFDITKDGEIVDMTGVDQSIQNDIIRGGVEIRKRDAETTSATPQGDATFYKAEFTITSLNENPVVVDGKTYDSNEDITTLVTDESGYASTSAYYLPYGHYKISETKAPEGYLNSGILTLEFDISEHGQMIDLTTAELSIQNEVIRGGVEIQKRDIQSSYAKAQGNASLENAEFTITNKSDYAVLVEGVLYEKGEVVKTIFTNADGYATTDADTLPYGSYTITEVTPPEGYLNEGILSRNFKIRKDGEIVNLTEVDDSIHNQVKRGDLELIKISDGTHKRLTNVPFKITSVTTGESHIIVTDENGHASTHADWNPHTQNTNQGKTSDDGIWFNGYNEEGSTEVTNDLGALPYDTYLIEEQPCDSNKGKELIPAFEIVLKRHNYEISLGTLTNDDKPKALISKVDATTGEQLAGATLQLYKKTNDGWELIGETVTTDEIWTFEVEPGDYKLVETLAPTGYLLSEAVEFTVEKGTVIKQVEMKDSPIEISGNIDKRQTIVGKGKTYYYTLDYCSTSNTWADELNVTDPLESVNAGYTRLISILTPVSFDDYDGLMNVWYQTNKTDPTDTSDAEKYSAQDTNPENPDNPENERMEDYTGWKIWQAGVSTLESQELLVADLNLAEDEYVTAFRFEHGRVEKGFTTRIQDTTELDPEKSEHDNLAEVLTPHEGTYNLKDAANPDLREDRELHYAPAVLKMQLITEDYIGGNIELVNSASMNIFRNKGVTDRLKDDDEDKVVQKIGEIIIHTTATNKVDGSKIIEAGENVTIIDTVTMKGLQIGTSYTLKGYEMVKEENAKLLINGKEITGEYTFTADNEEMQVEIAFTFDARTLGGKNLVTFEELYETENPDTPVAEHKDINDKGQTVTVKASEDTPEAPSISGPVKTGDNSPLLLYAILAGIALLVAAGIGIYYYRRNN